MVSKKKALAAAAQTLSDGAERMRETLAVQRRNRNVYDFYTELWRLRQRWRLRKVGNSIIGDLSYKQGGGWGDVGRGEMVFVQTYSIEFWC